MNPNITLDKIYQAQEILKTQFSPTPLLPFQNNIFLKAESLQPSGSFKIRGATYFLSQITPEQRSRGVVAYSTGNHAQAVALAAKKLNMKATIVMSPDAQPFKIEATKKYGAEIVMADIHSRKQTAEDLAAKTGAFFLPPFDHINVITGQGTIGLEILDAVTPEAVFVPVGGGGLIAGIAFAIKKLKPDVKIIGVEPDLDNDGYRSFKSGKLEGMAEMQDTIADAVKIGKLGTLTFPLIQEYVDDMMTVSEKQIAAATIKCAEVAHLFAEPSGALGLAGALAYPQKFSGPIVCILSGGNTTVDNLCKLEGT